jgi:hypothetical protein
MARYVNAWALHFSASLSKAKLRRRNASMVKINATKATPTIINRNVNRSLGSLIARSSCDPTLTGLRLPIYHTKITVKEFVWRGAHVNDHLERQEASRNSQDGGHADRFRPVDRGRRPAETWREIRTPGFGATTRARAAENTHHLDFQEDTKSRGVVPSAEQTGDPTSDKDGTAAS